MSYIPRLKREYKETVISNLKKEFEYNNIMQVPRLEKIVISKWLKLQKQAWLQMKALST